MSQSKIMHNVWLALAVLVFAGVFLWGYLDQNHCFPHSISRIICSFASCGGHSHDGSGVCPALHTKSPIRG